MRGAGGESRLKESADLSLRRRVVTERMLMSVAAACGLADRTVMARIDVLIPRWIRAICPGDMKSMRFASWGCTRQAVPLPQ